MGEIKKGYKQTDIGLIPEDWEVRTIGEVAKITTGRKNTEDKIDYGIFPFYVRSQIIEKINSYSFDCEGVLTAGDGVGTGKVFHYINGKFDFHQRVYLIYKFDNKLFGKYFYWFFSRSFYDRMSQLTAKSSVDSVRREMIADMPIILPTLDEQIAISTALSDIDALIAAFDKKITKKQQIKQGAMQQLLTGKKRLPGFSGEWVEKTIGQSLTIKHGKNQKDIEDSSGRYPILGTGGIMSFTNTPLYSKQSVLIGRKGTIDKPQFYDTPFWTVDTLFYSEIKDGYSAKFIFYKFNQIDWYDYNEASGVPSLNAKVIESIVIDFPPTLAEQTAIAQILTDMDNEISQLEADRNKYEQIKAGMMQQLLTGKIRING